MRLLRLAISVLIVVNIPLNLAHSAPLLIQTEAWPPLVMQDSKGRPTGHDYEIMAAVFDAMGVDFEFEFVPWKRLINNLKGKTADAVLGIIVTEERKGFLYFPEEPVSTGGYVLFYRKSEPFDYQDLTSLKGKRVGTIGGYSYSEAFKAADNFVKDALVGENALTSNFRKLLLRRLDLVIANKNVGVYTASNLGILDQLGYTKNYVSGSSDFHIGFARKAEHKILAKRFSEVLKQFKQTPRYRSILKQYGLLSGQR